jgi:hypothetical protein
MWWKHFRSSSPGGSLEEGPPALNKTALPPPGIGPSLAPPRHKPMRLFRLSLVFLLACLALNLAGCGPSKKEKATRERISEFYGAFRSYQEEHGDWPEKLEDLRPHIDNWDEFIVNPITGDNPGYEYTQPPANADPNEEIDDSEEGNSESSKEIVILVQLRDGKPDLTLKKLHVSGWVN